MSTLKTTNIQHPSASVPAITLDASGAMTGSFPSPNRNLLYNGAMQIHQRSASVAGITTTGFYTADRWEFALSAGTWTQTVEAADAPTGSGFRKSLKVLCTTAKPSLAASDIILIRQPLEGQDLQRIAKGTASAQQLTLSFWVKSNVTGTYIAYLNDVDNVRFDPVIYTINASGTWEKKTVVFDADTTGGAFDNDNLRSLNVVFGLGAGSNFTSSPLPIGWTSSSTSVLAGQINLASSINNYWQITGVQLETGAVATPFEFKSYAQELTECERYFQKFSGNSSDEFFVPIGFYLDANQICFPLQCNTMRSAPIVTYTGTANTDYKVLNNGSPQSGFTFTYQKSTLQGTVLTASKTSHGVPNTATASLAVFPSGSVNLSSEL